MISPAFCGLAWLAGMLTVLSPCVLPILPLLLGQSLRSHQLGPIALVGGMILGFALMGSIVGLAINWIGGFAVWARRLAMFVLLIVGLLAFFPKWSTKLLSAFHWQPRSIGQGWRGEFWLGTQLGLLWTPCGGQVLSSILLLAAAERQVVQSFLLLLIFGFGAALPMLIFAYGGKVFSQRVLKLQTHSQALQKWGGGMVAVTAVAILLGWDVKIQLWVASFLGVPQL